MVQSYLDHWSLGQEMLRVAHGRRDGKPRRLASTSSSYLHYFL